jgi:hypothetical protein
MQSLIAYWNFLQILLYYNDVNILHVFGTCKLYTFIVMYEVNLQNFTTYRSLILWILLTVPNPNI